MSQRPNPRVELPWEQQAIRNKCFHPTGTFIEFRREEIEQSIPERFEQQVRRYPDRLAVKTKRHALTYEALNQAANRIAQAILAYRGAGPEPVALLLEKDAPLLAAIFGALKAGKFYVPLDPSFPQARTAYMLGNSQAGLVVTNSQNLALARELAQDARQLLNIDALDSRLSTADPGLGIPADSLAYIIYTSGSTGQPKGVVQTHRNVLHSIMNRTNDFHLCADDRVTFLSSASFSGAVKEIFGALLKGAALLPFDMREESVAHLAHWLRQEELTIYLSVATVFRHFVSTLTGEEQFPKLRLIFLASEPVYKRDVELYKKHFAASCILSDGFGTTEHAPARIYYFDKHTQMQHSVLPAGYPVEDTEVLLLEDGKEVGVNQIGEIALKSRYLSPGYWQRPDLTQAAFLPDPNGGDARIYRTGDLGLLLPDGCLLHLGRQDFQVKIRGHRVEAAEIETALLNAGNIKEASVVLREDRPGDQRLVAYLVPAQKPAPTIPTLRRMLAATLPGYMVPAAFVLLDALPLLPSGKVDRRALPAPDSARPALQSPFVAPRTPVEEALAGIWAEALNLDQVGIYDNFLELGGDSLLATQVLAQVIRTLQVEVPLRSLLASPTVADMAVVITQSQAQQAEPADMERLLAALEAPSDEQAQGCQ